MGEWWREGRGGKLWCECVWKLSVCLVSDSEKGGRSEALMGSETYWRRGRSGWEGVLRGRL